MEKEEETYEMASAVIVVCVKGSSRSLQGGVQ